MRISDWSSDVCSSDLSSISNLVTSAHGHLREVINELHTAVLDRFGLTRAIAEGPFAELLRDRGVLYTSRVQGRVDHLPEDRKSVVSGKSVSVSVDTGGRGFVKKNTTQPERKNK